MKPAILILVHAILIASQVPHGVNSEEIITLNKVPKFDSKLIRAVQRYNEAISAQREIAGEITDIAGSLQQAYTNKISELNGLTKSDAKTVEQYLLKHLQKLYKELITHYTTIKGATANISKFDQQKLDFQFAKKRYEEVESVTNDLYYISNAAVIPQLVEMRQKNKRLVAALKNLNFICDVTSQNERSTITGEIRSLIDVLLEQCNAGTQELSNTIFIANEEKCKQQQKSMCLLFDRLKSHYQRIRDAFCENSDDCTRPILFDDKETPKMIESIYYTLSYGILECSVTF